MTNILDYLDWRGDLPMTQVPFNEVDNLILAELAYADLDGIVPPPQRGESLCLREAAEIYLALGREQSYLLNDPKALLKAAGGSIRFGEIALSDYLNEINAQRQSQFAALAFHLADGSCYAAFRGTDDTLVGWREDFNFSFLSETPGQSQAVRYLERLAAATDGPLRVGGHSKGGNLAVYAAAFCDQAVKARIIEVFSNDGPGFNKAVAESQAYREALGKVRLIIPESSLVGILLSNKADRKIVKSSANGVQQHDPYSWAVMGDHLVEAEQLSPASAMMDEALHRWVDALDDSQRENLVSAIFDALDASGAQTLTELSSHRWPAYSAVLKAVLEMDPAKQKDVRETLKKLGAAGTETLWGEARHSLDSLVHELFSRAREEKKHG